jgi:hypothetical protein
MKKLYNIDKIIEIDIIENKIDNNITFIKPVTFTFLNRKFIIEKGGFFCKTQKRYLKENEIGDRVIKSHEIYFKPKIVLNYGSDIKQELIFDDINELKEKLKEIKSKLHLI